MKQDAVRTSINLPSDSHRKLHEVAAPKGCSARKLILSGIERVIEKPAPDRPRRELSLNPRAHFSPAGLTIPDINVCGPWPRPNTRTTQWPNIGGYGTREVSHLSAPPNSASCA
jgi:hypothetical protein